MSPGPFGDVRRFETIDSTNRYLLDQARAGAPEGLVAVADFQTAGRGRRGRRWSAPAGANLLVSVLLRPRLPAASRSLAVAAVALAAREAVLRTCAVTLGVKWPNDLVDSQGRKVAGVLAETDVGPREGPGDDGWGGQAPAVVVGVGLNCDWPPAAPGPGDDDLAPGASSLAQLTGRSVDREEVLAAFLDGLAARRPSLDDAAGRAALRDELEDACSTLGSPVRVELADRTVEGRATGLTDEGHLVVATPQGLETVVTGDVVHLRPT